MTHLARLPVASPSQPLAFFFLSCLVILSTFFAFSISLGVLLLPGGLFLASGEQTHRRKHDNEMLWVFRLRLIS